MAYIINRLWQKPVNQPATFIEIDPQQNNTALLLRDSIQLAAEITDDRVGVPMFVDMVGSIGNEFSQFQEPLATTMLLKNDRSLVPLSSEDVSALSGSLPNTSWRYANLTQAGYRLLQPDYTVYRADSAVDQLADLVLDRVGELDAVSVGRHSLPVINGLIHEWYTHRGKLFIKGAAETLKTTNGHAAGILDFTRIGVIENKALSAVPMSIIGERWTEGFNLQFEDLPGFWFITLAGTVLLPNTQYLQGSVTGDITVYPNKVSLLSRVKELGIIPGLTDTSWETTATLQQLLTHPLSKLYFVKDTLRCKVSATTLPDADLPGNYRVTETTNLPIIDENGLVVDYWNGTMQKSRKRIRITEGYRRTVTGWADRLLAGNATGNVTLAEKKRVAFIHFGC